MDLSQDTESAIRSALSLLPEHQVAGDLRRLVDLCRDAREHGRDGLSDLDTAESRLRSALDQANNLVEAGPDEELAIEAMEAESTAGEGASAFGHGAWEFRDASADQQGVTEGLRRVMGSL